MGLLSHTAPVSGEHPINSNTMFFLAFLVPWRFQLPNLGSPDVERLDVTRE
jgi:hypothetical protein